MAKLPQKDDHNKNLAAVEASDRLFADAKRHHLVWQTVRYQMAKRHLGTHRAKTRSFVSLTSKRPYAQKGTGQARTGDFRSPLLVGGGQVFPPQPRDYSFSLPKKARKSAVRSVLTDKLASEKLTVLADHGLKAVKTKDAKALVDRLGLNKALFVIPGKDDLIEKSMRNLKGVKVLRVDGLNVYDLLRFEHVVILKESLPLMEKRF
jgi:large subunit ribosomal protein L4